jgi:hypothetical protein
MPMLGVHNRLQADPQKRRGFGAYLDAWWAAFAVG